jgi:hypothetical protein
MKRLIRYATIAFALLSLSACECNEGTEPRPDRLGKTIWDIAYPDLRRVNEILDLVANYNYYLTIDVAEPEEGENTSESEADRYRREELNNPVDISIVENKHTLTYETNYGTTYTITFEMLEDRWEVKRTGGNGFDLTISEATEADTYVAHFNTIYNSESTGDGDFKVKLSYDEVGTPDIEFKGTLIMVDREASNTHPLTVTTKITDWLRFRNERHYESVPTKGRMTVTVEDKLYGTTDEISASIVNSYDRYGVSIECLGDVHGYYF